jgi:hypothetical protein
VIIIWLVGIEAAVELIWCAVIHDMNKRQPTKFALTYIYPCLSLSPADLGAGMSSSRIFSASSRNHFATDDPLEI